MPMCDHTQYIVKEIYGDGIQINICKLTVLIIVCIRLKHCIQHTKGDSNHCPPPLELVRMQKYKLFEAEIGFFIRPSKSFLVTDSTMGGPLTSKVHLQYFRPLPN
jgi:hypothetical protein